MNETNTPTNTPTSKCCEKCKRVSWIAPEIGETINYCDDARCSCHTSPTPDSKNPTNQEVRVLKTNTEILAEFDELGGLKTQEESWSCDAGCDVDREKIKNFWVTVLNQRTEDIVGMVLEMEKFIKKRYGIMEEDGQDAEIAYNQALTDIINKIKALYGVEKQANSLHKQIKL